MKLGSNQDTICAPATIPGTGAISIIRVSGKDTFTVVDKVLATNGVPVSETEGYRLRYCTVCNADGSVLDNVLVSVFRAPHSYTGENSVEISCHASKFIVNELLQLLIKSGARVAEPGEFTRRAFLNGKMDLAQAEAVADVIASQSAASHRVAMNQLKGGYSLELKSLRDQLLDMTSLLELELDFSEEDVEFANREQLKKLVSDTLAHTGRLADSFSRGNAIRNGIPVAIAGATNTGKSTLLNALLGEDRAIVSDIAGTTRDTIEETFNIDGVLFRFIDTAGIRETDEAIEKIGIGRTFKKMNEASIVLGMTDVTRGEDAVTADAGFIWKKVNGSLDRSSDPSSPEKKLILVLNKCDRLDCCGVSGNETVSVPEYGSPLPADMDTSSADEGVSGSFGAEKDEISGEKMSNKNVNYINNLVSHIKSKGIDCEIIPISAKDGYGLSTLKKSLSEVGKGLSGSTDSTLVTNARHYEALVNAANCLQSVSDGLASALPSDLIAQDLREALYHLGSILGEITTDEILGNIFKNFCIGK